MTARRRQTVPAHVDVDIPAVPTSTMIPQNLGKTIIWMVGIAVLVLGGWVSWLLIAKDSKEKADAHDAAFSTKTEMKEHQREDIQAITKLAESTNASIMKLTDAINLQSANAEVSRQWVKSSNLAVQASVTDLIARTCRKDNANSKDPLACDKELTAAKEAAADVKNQAAKANEVTSSYQRVQIVPPTVATPGSGANKP